MKKLLLALVTVLGMSVAQAQSSVTVYGLMDLGLAGGNVSQVANGTATKTTGSALTNNIESTNRLGFKGTEDLGGGTFAFFTVEVALTPNGQQAIDTSATQNRQTFVGLRQNGIGNFAIGTQYTPVHNSVTSSDPGAANNLVGNAIFNRNSYGATAASSQIGNGGNDTNSSYVVRSNNSLTLNSENINGLTAHAMLVSNGTNTNQATTTTGSTTAVTGGTTNTNGWGLGADYTIKNLYLTAAYQAFKNQSPYTINSATGAYTAGTPVVFGVNGASTAGTNVQDNNGYIAAVYDFGVLKAYAQYVTRKVNALQSSNQYVKRTAEQIGVRSFVTPTIEAWVSAGVGRYSAFGAGQPTANFTAYQIGANYWLSKRTNLYAIVGAENTSTYATVNSAGVATGINSYNTNGYGLGIRHTF